MPVEYILDVVFAFGVLSAFVVLAMCCRDILPKVSTDKLLQSIEQEEIKFDEAVQKLPDNVIELNMLHIPIHPDHLITSMPISE